MPRSILYTQLPYSEIYSEIIDVRSPTEFAADHLPGAINLPVLNDPQRAEVGTLYKQVDPFMARKVGAAWVSQNIGRYLIEHFSAKERDYRPLVYCWRGGQRSHSMALVLAEIGWAVTLLQGGYKTYRTYVRERLQVLPQKFTYRVLCGPTGSGKTHILQQMQQRGAQVLNLESLANHRGSLLGQVWHAGGEREDFSPLAQPSQKYFESLLLQTLQSLDPQVPVWLESESNKIGCLYLPELLWHQMTQASCVAIELPIAGRIEWLLQEYPHLMAAPDVLKSKLKGLKSRYGQQKLTEWDRLIEAGLWEALVRDLLECHYDPTYRRSLQRWYPNLEQVFRLPDLSHPSINSLINFLLPSSW